MAKDIPITVKMDDQIPNALRYMPNINYFCNKHNISISDYSSCASLNLYTVP